MQKQRAKKRREIEIVFEFEKGLAREIEIAQGLVQKGLAREKERATKGVHVSHCANSVALTQRKRERQ